MRNITLIVIVSVAVILASVLIGPKIISPFSIDDISKQVIVAIRLPRVIVALLMGCALGASGAVLQGILRNPLADPYILGISSGAALVAVMGILLGSTALGLLTVPVFAFVGAIVTGLLVGAMGYKKGGLLPERLLLAGVGLGFLFSAVLMMILSVSTDEGLRRAVLWVYGDLSMADWSLIPYGLFFIIVGLTISLLRAKGLNALMLGDDIAYSLGFSPDSERALLFVSVGLMTASAVSLGGIVGFVGLLVPHIVRFIAGSDGRVLIPLSALMGGTLLCFADTVGRTVMAPMELPSGIITAIIGAPYFLYLLRKKDVLGERK
ncbi:MAG: iron ABC transporter permease [Nitrospirota bacterium]|nr:MAG: iron ABC transporter permease [Nitrospirota bacterium]